MLEGTRIHVYRNAGLHQQRGANYETDVSFDLIVMEKISNTILCGKVVGLNQDWRC